MTDFIAAILGVIIYITILAIILALPVMWLWNWLIPEIFVNPVLNTITFWQALGLTFLCGILFKGNSLSSSD